MIRFVLNGTEYQLTRAVVEQRTAKHHPETAHKHLVCINGAWFPVKQAFEIAIGVPRAQFTSQIARRHLASLGFETAGEVEPRHPHPGPHLAAVSDAGNSPQLRPRRANVFEGLSLAPPPPPPDWFYEGQVQSRVVEWLVTDGWAVLSVANTESRERGIDILVRRGGETLGVEVKGFPSRHYADPRRAHETKPTSPSTQAGHWYAQAVLAAMRLRGKQPTWRSAIALPDFDRYRDLYAETATSLDAAGVEMVWVSADGTVSAAPRA